jgi:hypothetical protein
MIYFVHLREKIRNQLHNSKNISTFAPIKTTSRLNTILIKDAGSGIPQKRHYHETLS